MHTPGGGLERLTAVDLCIYLEVRLVLLGGLALTHASGHRACDFEALGGPCIMACIVQLNNVILSCKACHRPSVPAPPGALTPMPWLGLPLPYPQSLSSRGVALGNGAG